MGWSCEFLWDRHSGVSKVNSHSGLVFLLGEVLDFCDLAKLLQNVLEVCDNISSDAAAELLLQGVMFYIRSSNGLWRDGGKLFSFCIF